LVVLELPCCVTLVVAGPSTLSWAGVTLTQSLASISDPKESASITPWVGVRMVLQKKWMAPRIKRNKWVSLSWELVGAKRFTNEYVQLYIMYYSAHL